MKYINVILKVVKLVEEAHEKKMKVISTIPTSIRVKNDDAETGTYMNRHPEGKDIVNVHKSHGSWYWRIK
jgi:hypothetical protein